MTADAKPEMATVPAPRAQTTPGLSTREAEESRARYGTNEMPMTTSRSVWQILRANVFTLFNGIVLACFTLLAVLGRWQDAIFGFSAVANSVIGVWQEYSAKRALDNLSVMHAPVARAYRDGELEELRREDLVVGDVISVRTGDQISADALVLESSGLQLDESLLTGEEDAVEKQPGQELLSGAIVVAGSGTATVQRVGDQAFAAKLTLEAKRFSLVNSEIRNGLNRVLRIVAWLIAPVLVIVVNGQIWAFGGWDHAIETGAWKDAAVGAVAAVIAMVPLGLLLMTSVAFAAGALKLGSKKVLVQELHAVEGLARVDLVCFDKTGTLTEGGVTYQDTHLGANPHAGWQRALASIAAQETANETAKSFAAAYGAELAVPIAHEIPFNSQRKWSAVTLTSSSPTAPAATGTAATGTVAADTATGSWILGGPDVILQAGVDDELLAQVADFAARGSRVLALCHSPQPLTEADTKAERLPRTRRGTLILTLRERIRTDASDTVRYFRDEGVELRVISGDDPRTVTAVAREVGLIRRDEEGVDARELPTDRAQLAEYMETHRIFGRVSPTQKRDMVKALQARGHVVAMTGDGVNDVLALKEADLGIAMGTGSGASRAVSRLTLLDNQFHALPSVVLEGRKAIANVERLSMLYLTKTAWAILIAVLFGAFLWQYPFEPRQMSILDGISIGWPAFVLALIPNTRRYLVGFFRRAVLFALPAGAIVTVAIIATIVYGNAAAQSVAQLQTAASIVLAVLSLWVLGIVSRPLKPVLVAVLLGAVAVLFLALFTPLTVWFFGFEWPDAPVLWAVAIICSVGCALLEVHGQLRRRSTDRALAKTVVQSPR